LAAARKDAADATGPAALNAALAQSCKVLCWTSCIWPLLKCDSWGGAQVKRFCSSPQRHAPSAAARTVCNVLLARSLQVQVLCHVCCDHVLFHRQGAWLLDKLHTHNPAGTSWASCMGSMSYPCLEGAGYRAPAACTNMLFPRTSFACCRRHADVMRSMWCHVCCQGA
jgi:hypothetical protein